MAAGRWILVNQWASKQLSTPYDWDAASALRVILVSNASNISAAATTMAAVTNQLSTANGYTSGGATPTVTVSQVNTRDANVKFSVAWTPTGAGFTACWAVLGVSGGDVLMYAPLNEIAGVANNYTPTVNKLFTLNSSGVPLPAFILNT